MQSRTSRLDHNFAVLRTPYEPDTFPSSDKNSGGFTLVELVMVILIVAVLATVVTTRFDALTLFRKKGELRSFLNTWQFLVNEAAGDGNTYRLIIDLDNNSYFVRQEIPLPPNNIEHVDLMKNLRLRSEKERKQREEDERALSVEDAAKVQEEQEENMSVEELFASALFRDAGKNVQLALPVNYASLGEEQVLSDSVRIRNIILDGEMISSGRAELFFSPQGVSSIAVVHFDVGDQQLTAILNPLSGESRLLSGEADVQFIERGSNAEVR